jgi:CBS domain-containing protein
MRSTTEQRPEHRDLRDAPAATLMSRPPVTVRLAEFLDAALLAFRVHDVRHLVVVDPGGRCVGMLTDRSVTAWWVAQPMAFDRTRVSDVWHDDEPFVGERSTLADVARTMRRCGGDAVVVVDAEQRPVGVVTATDLIALLANANTP